MPDNSFMDPISSMGSSGLFPVKPKEKSLSPPASGTSGTTDLFGQAAAFLDLSTRGRLDGASEKPLSREEATEVAQLVGKMIKSGIVGWEWRKDDKGQLHRVFLENTLTGTPKDYRPLKPGEK